MLHLAVCHRCAQGEVLQVLKGASLLANTLLSASHSSPPDTLLSTAMALHDSCLLVRQGSTHNFLHLLEPAR